MINWNYKLKSITKNITFHVYYVYIFKNRKE